MHITWPSSSRAEPLPALAVALSGRALATAARRAGAPAMVLDLFADEDTACDAILCRKLPRASSPLPLWEREGPVAQQREGEGAVQRAPVLNISTVAPLTLPSLRDGPLPLPQGERGFLEFDRDALLDAVHRLANKVSGLVYGGGFEHDPALLRVLGSSVAILGNPPEVVAATKDPLGFAALLERLGAPHPETTLRPPAEGSWLAKQIGGSGGGHVVPARHGAAIAGTYFQRRVAGRAVSALFLGDGRRACILGYSEQWAAPSAAAPYRYGGCVAPVAFGTRVEAAIDELCQALVRSLGLVGLNSLDLLLEGERFEVLEINPRPGATLDVFDGRDGWSLWRAHLEAVAGRLPAIDKMAGPPCAAAVAYAHAPLRIPRFHTWPGWTADRGRAGTIIEAGAPVCTVMATAETPQRARQCAELRTRRLLERLEPVLPARA